MYIYIIYIYIYTYIYIRLLKYIFKIIVCKAAEFRYRRRLNKIRKVR